MSLNEWLSQADPTQVLVALLSGTGLLATLVTLLISWVRSKPTHQEQEKAMETVVAPAPDRDALHIARQALEASATDRAAVTALQARLDDMGGKVDRVTEINGQLWQWIRDIRGQWHIVRLNEDPPPEPIIKNS
ncbi:hypothetical protein ACW9PK_12320 [Kocuria sp. MNB10]